MRLLPRRLVQVPVEDARQGVGVPQTVFEKRANVISRRAGESAEYRARRVGRAASGERPLDRATDGDRLIQRETRHELPHQIVGQAGLGSG